MTSLAPAKEWWTAGELAAAGLNDLPVTTRGISKLAARDGWYTASGLARPRAARGGGWEFHWTLLPQRAQKALLQEAAKANAKQPPARRTRDELWAWYDGLGAKAKATAQQRLAVIQAVEGLVAGGTTKVAAVHDAARDAGVSPRSVFGWMNLIAGARADDRLPLLAPRYDSVARAAAVQTADCSPEWWDALKADFLRLEEPSFSTCYRRAVSVAKTKGWKVLPERTARRRLEAEVSEQTRLLARKGVAALKAKVPPQRRDKATLHAMEAVNADFHKWDVWVRWPGQDLPVRPQMVAWQDVHSGKVLSWRLALTPNKDDVALSFGEMVSEYGIPDHVLFDNGREFANKFLTGQASHRHRFRSLPTDIPGLLRVLGCQEHFATPYSGQSKPIERAFRDMCDAIARDPRFAGAWTGNRPDAKPENYQSAAVPFEVFLAVVAEGIDEHNARPGRRSDVAAGRSFNEVFDASYATAPIRKATEAQRRLWLMGAEGIKADSASGLIRFQGNEYWAPWQADIAGQRVVVRFDPADLWAGVHVYSLGNAFLGHAPCRAKTGFFDVDGAKAQARARSALLKAERAVLAAHRRVKMSDLAALLNGAAEQDGGRESGGGSGSRVQAKVVRPSFKLPRTALAPATTDPATDRAVDRTQERVVADVASFADARARRTQAAARSGSGGEAPGADHQRFRQAREIMRRMEAGEPVPREQEHWLNLYQGQPEYRALERLYADFGEDMFGGG